MAGMRTAKHYAPSETATAITDDLIVNADVKTNAGIAFSKLAALDDGKILVGNGSNVATKVAMSGDATIDNAGAVTIANSAITNAKVHATAAIAFSKLAALADGNILVGNGSNVAASVAMSGDATLANTGAITIANNAITTSKINNTSITAAKMAMFISNETIGTGSSQSIAHGLSGTPTKVMVVPTELDAGLVGGYDVAEGSHTSSNVVLTATSGLKFKVFAML